MMTTTHGAKHRSHWITETILGLVVLAVVAPIGWMLLLAFQSARAIITPGWAFDFSLASFVEVLDPAQPYLAQLQNSVLIVLGTVILCLLVGGLAGYSLSALGWRPRTVGLILAGSAVLPIIPPMALVPGLYATLNGLGVLGSVSGLILLNTVFNLPFATILMKINFDGVPGDLREAALIDGASNWRIFRQIMLPVAAPGAASVAIYTAIMAWNEFLFGLTMTAGGTTAPITVGIASLVQPYQIAWGQMAAIGAITAVPIIVISIFASRRIVSGLTQGATKG
jgi:ABC-type glycerol-3-phosphate transport system permease component